MGENINTLIPVMEESIVKKIESKGHTLIGVEVNVLDINASTCSAMIVVDCWCDNFISDCKYVLDEIETEIQDKYNTDLCFIDRKIDF